MFSNFKKCFNPTQKEQIQNLERMIELHSEHIRECCTCKNAIIYKYPTPSAFGYKGCLKNENLFYKVFSDKKIDCEYYEELTENINKLKALKGE